MIFKMKNKQGQMKIQEIAFVLIALMLLFSMIFIFYVRLQSADIEKKTAELRQKQALTLLDKVIAMPELRCSAGFGSEGLCIDKYKAEIMAKQEFRNSYEGLFKGVKEVRIKEIYPAGNEYVIFTKDYEGYEEYTAFTRVCEEIYEGGNTQKCILAKVSVLV